MFGRAHADVNDAARGTTSTLEMSLAPATYLVECTPAKRARAARSRREAYLRVWEGSMTPVGIDDARIFALESDTIRGHTMKVLLIDDAPEEDVVPALRAEVAQRLAALPRWRQRVVPAPGTPAGLAWDDAPDFDVAEHVRAIRGREPVDERELRRILAATMSVPLDRARPLWTIEVVPRLADGRWAIVWKVHHGLADGTMMMRAGARLLWTAAPSPAREPSHRSGGPPALVIGARIARLIGHRGLVVRELRRVWRLSPLAAEVGHDRVIDFDRFALDDLRSAGKAVSPDVTINDVLLALVAGALRRWLASRQAAPARLKAQVPVSMHQHLAESDVQGNRDSFLLLELPIGEADPIARVRAVTRATRKRKSREDARAIDALARSLVKAPEPVKRALRHVVQGPHEYSLNVSNVPGPRGPIHVLGRRVDALVPFAEIAPNHALRVAALSMAGTMFVGLCADSHVLPDLDVLSSGLRASLDELRAAIARVTPDVSAAAST